MHPFCCVSTVSERSQAATSSQLKDMLDISRHPPPATARSDLAAGSRDAYPRTSSVDLNGNNNCNHGNGVHGNGMNHNCGTNDFDHCRMTQRVEPSMSDLSSRLPSMNEAQLLLGDHREVKINDIVGNGISGILYKWVNYGKGWRPRWFVLQDGVLSYYKIHGPDKINVNQETEKGIRIIGEESMRRVCRPRHGKAQLQRKPFGEIHLKVSSIRESKSDDKRFSIFTGTKRLHLRAETREDRLAWMEALQAVKDMFPRMSNSELMAPLENITVSTEKLRQRLLEEGVNEAAIQDSEQIMRSEFSALQNQLLLLKQKQVLLLDTLRQLEVYLTIRRKHHANGIQNSSSVCCACSSVANQLRRHKPRFGSVIELPSLISMTEKVDLENTLVDESQKQSKEYESSNISRQEKYSEGSASESDDYNERHDAAEEETDDDDNTFFDTRDFLSSSSYNSSSGSDFQRSSVDSDDEEPYACDSEGSIDSSVKFAGTNYPRMRRRKKLPDPVEKEKGVSLWSLIKDNIGKDLTKVCLPVYFNEPLSSLQKCFEDLEYSYLIDQANEWGKRGNSLMRILNVAAFAVSGYASTEGRNCKPFNPLLGETYEADFPDKGLRFFSEKVSHHPMIIACHCEGNGWKFWGDSNLKSKFWGRSIQLDPVGIITLEFDDGEVFQWSKVHGIVQDRNGKIVATLFGKWDESMHYVIGDYSGKGKGSQPLSEARILWKRSKPSNFPTRYNLTRFAITLNELTPGLKEKLPPTDSRLRPDQRCLENGEYELANSEKLRLEQRQRQARKMQERGWKPRWFAKEKGSETYRYIGGYWEARKQGRWESCPDIFGHVPIDQTLD
ncbi:PREDICTED: oxysterol-binding protein-related protein 1C-like isoform X2 [Nelumbo nucifera]|uniref:Oxysterol-binding protein-related protein 1C-like isoform X2 n=1 Tax=Nelumbo nucifera TaxID=4432 RepID=A0A1U7ZFB1_NELNU|nr:PREDICTED: oxysterol-binding protein-related protein 1C-like isoform X2 [Nelumbo nucifera]